MPRGTPDLPKDHPDRRRIWNTWVCDPSLTRDESFCEATGEVGDVYLLHPFMLHSASRNLRREVRIITNPPVSLKEPFCYDGRSPSLVEQKTLRELGREGGMPEWKITAARERLVPDRIRVSSPISVQNVLDRDVLANGLADPRGDEAEGDGESEEQGRCCDDFGGS